LAETLKQNVRRSSSLKVVILIAR